MRLLCIDIGSTTQDILYLDTEQPVENAIQLVLPSPTVLTARKIDISAAARKNILLTGETMGGGACTSAVKRHLESGLKVFATSSAARTFDDDLEEVASWGIELITENEKTGVRDTDTIVLTDLDTAQLQKALSSWNIELRPDAVAVAVLDHGVAPKGESDRFWRFRYLEELLQNRRSLKAFMFSGAEVPWHFSRMQALVRSYKLDVPIVLMDTGAAAVLGLSLDPAVARHKSRLAVNMGNSHTIAFNLRDDNVLGFFEHHTSQMTREKAERLLLGLSSGTITGQEIREDGGHGGLVFERSENTFITITGPRRSVMSGSRLNLYFASPFGSMMLTGCYGLLKAASLKLPRFRSEIEAALSIYQLPPA